MKGYLTTTQQEFIVIYESEGTYKSLPVYPAFNITKSKSYIGDMVDFEIVEDDVTYAKLKIK